MTKLALRKGVLEHTSIIANIVVMMLIDCFEY